MKDYSDSLGGKLLTITEQKSIDPENEAFLRNVNVFYLVRVLLNLPNETHGIVAHAAEVIPMQTELQTFINFIYNKFLKKQ